MYSLQHYYISSPSFYEMQLVNANSVLILRAIQKRTRILGVPTAHLN
jgi:hypothetical protein